MLSFNRSIRSKGSVGFAMTTVGAAALLSVASVAYCDDAVSMAPPIQADIVQSGAPDPANASASSVFNWSEVPQNQNVPITRAVFDQGGYQLYDSAGETIVVPFTNNNLYVMKFAVSPDGTTYFVNTGDYPVLYIPSDGYLENAAVPGARWFPFTDDFQPAQPVFLGCAPSWNDYIAMGWYPDMSCYGGYWCGGPVLRVGAIFPTVGLFFQVGNAGFGGWAPYRSFCGLHPAPYRVRVINPNIYNWSRPVYAHNRSFTGVATWQGHPASFGRVFNGAGRPYMIGGARGFGGQTVVPPHFSNNAPGNSWGQSSTSTIHVFRGNSDSGINGGHGVSAPDEHWTVPAFDQHGAPQQSAPTRSFQGFGRSYSLPQPQQGNDRSWSEGSRQSSPPADGGHSSPAPTQQSSGNSRGGAGGRSAW